jgi:hypothetical protein
MKTRQRFQFAVIMMIYAVIAMSANAQKGGPRLGIGIDVGSTLKSPTRMVLGADLRLQQPFGQGVSGILTTGYYQFFKADSYYESFGIIPLKAGLKIFPVKNVYIAGEVGAGFGTKKGAGTSFVYSPSFGVAFGDGFDASLKYENYTDYKGDAQQLALRFAYGFKL